MAIEKVTMMNVIGSNEYTDDFIRDIYLYGDVQMANAMEEIENGRFTLPISKSNIKEMVGFSNLQSGEEIVEDNKWETKRQRLLQLYNDSLKFDVSTLGTVYWTKKETLEHLSIFDSFVDDVLAKIQSEKEKLADLDRSIKTYGYLSDIDIDMSELDQMTYFTYSLGTVPKQNAERLKRIYNAVTSVIFHVDDIENEEVFLVISPKELEIETNRILRSVGFKPMTGLSTEYVGKPADIVSKLKREKQQRLTDIEKMESEQLAFCKKHLEEAHDLYNHLELFANIDDMKRQLAFSDSNFYFSCWISAREKDNLKNLKKKYPNIIIQFGEEDSGSKPPTKLKNNWFFRPFENLVKMYGIPSHDELDPTPFLSITYLFCF
ncbi:MAG: ATPase, partial [Eubacteriaceae bacterium]|nr:ATPase [Eubacteriaceae bacterium]